MTLNKNLFINSNYVISVFPVNIIYNYYVISTYTYLIVSVCAISIKQNNIKYNTIHEQRRIIISRYNNCIFMNLSLFK